MKVYRLALRSFIFFIICGLFLYIYSYFKDITYKSRETYDRERIKDYQWAQMKYFEVYNKYGLKSELGVGLELTLDLDGVHEKVYERLSIVQVKELGFDLDLPILVTNHTYRVIFEVKDCNIRKVRSWLVEKDKFPRKLGEALYICDF